MCDVIRVREVKPFGHLDVPEGLYKLGLLFLIIVGGPITWPTSKERLNHYIFDNVDIVSAYTCDLLFLRDHDYIVTF